MGKNTFEPEAKGINIISFGTKIKGDIVSNSDIRIDGELLGNITTSGKLVIGESGNLCGHLHCKNGDISGSITGQITVTDLLQLKSTARIEGDIIVNKLAVDPGCVFTGTCKMDNESLNNSNSFEKTYTENEPSV